MHKNEGHPVGALFVCLMYLYYRICKFTIREPEITLV